MANNPIVVLHGWSDETASFQPLAKALAKATGQPVNNLWLGGYISLDDDVKLADISKGLQRAWRARGLPTEPNKVDVVVHSTGGLVIREWMHEHYTRHGQRPPVQNLVMLAPANFGSPLAHKGRALIGRAIKGFGSGFETGTHILKALEMGSPHTWELAERDRFGPNVFSRDGVRCTVIVGNRGYQGISGIANEDGSDGTVYVASAALDCARLKMTVERSSDDLDPGRMDRISVSAQELSRGATALLVLDNYDHGTIIGRQRLPKSLLDDIVAGLQVTQQAFGGWVSVCAGRTEEVMARYASRRDTEKHAFQNTVFRVMDDQGAAVNDYAIEFYGDIEDRKDFWARVFNRDVAAKTHVYGDNPAYRSFMIDVTHLIRAIDRKGERLCISLSALPDVMLAEAVVGYKSTGNEHIGRIELSPDQLRAYFRPNRTLLVDIVVPRYQKADVAHLRHLGENEG